MPRLAKLIYILFLFSLATAQEQPLDILTQKYISFEYKEVIELADKMIDSGDYNSNQLVQILELKGMAHYSLGEETTSKTVFENLLRLNSNHSMDPTRISPKIVNFFNEIKVAFLNSLEQERPILDSLRLVKQELITAQSNYKMAVVKNLVLPGWGHFAMDKTTGGIIYSAVGLGSTAAAVYYIIKTNDAKNAYLNETDKLLINTKYDDYNSSYKVRNFFIVAAALVWAASQVDLLFFTDITTQPHQAASSPGITPQEISIGFSFPLN